MEGKGKGDQSLFQRLLERHVVQSAAIYVAVAWGALEILITVQEKLGWPESISTWATRLFVAGFPVAVILAWRREIESRAARKALVTLALAAAITAIFLTFDAPQTSDIGRLPPVSEAIAAVTVLPFENATGDSAYEYLSRGFTGELIGRLSKHPDLAVIQEESVHSPQLAGLLPLAQAARLSADFLVQGNILREDEFIEVNASLQDADGRVLWSEILREPYTAKNVTAMQRRISGEVSRLLGATLEAPAYCGETTDIDAMELYYRGRQKVGTRTNEAMEAGMELLEQAVERDPYFGRGWNALGSAQAVLAARVRDGFEDLVADPERAAMLGSMARTSFRRALDICETIGSAYKLLVPGNDEIKNEAIDQELQWRAALALDPNDAAMLRQYSFHLMQYGLNDRAIEVMQRAYRNEPLLPMIPAQLALALYKVSRCDEALPLVREARELGAWSPPLTGVASKCAYLRGDLEAMIAISSSEQSEIWQAPIRAMNLSAEDLGNAQIDPDYPLKPSLSERMRGLWEENPDPRENPHIYWMIDIAAQINDLDLVFDIMESFVQHRYYGYTMAYSPFFEANEIGSRVRSDPRFVELFKNFGYPVYSYPGYWREYGWPTGCAPEGDSFRCF